MKRNIIFFVLVILVVFQTKAQQYKSHTVAKGENVYRIAKRYNTTPEAIYKINPNAKDGIKEGEVLAIPVSDNQEFKTHEVQEGDTVYSLAKKYQTSPEAIFGLNPEAVNGISIGQILRVVKIKKAVTNTNIEGGIPVGKDAVIDSLKADTPERKIVSFTTHKVKRKETLYSIAKKYSITVDDIKRHNKKLYAQQVRKKDKLRIPLYEEEETGGTSNLLYAELPKTKEYTIKPKDTKYNIAWIHGLTIKELELMNPNMDPALPIGSKIVVPYKVTDDSDSSKGSINIEEELELYEVPDGETVFNILRKTKISSDSLFGMNPSLRNGLKIGMVLKLPKKRLDSLALSSISEEVNLDLPNKLYNFKTKKIAVMLPFELDTVKQQSRIQTEDYLKRKQVARVSLDFYRGVKIALDLAKDKGIATEVRTYDTQRNNNESHIIKIIQENNFDEVDAVIGPLFLSNVETVVKELKKYETPVFSPISKKESKPFSNFFQTRPSEVILQDRLISFVEKDSLDKNIILVLQEGEKHEAIGNKLKAKFPEAKIAKIQEGNYLYEVHLNKVLDGKKPNWVILESSDIAMISNVTALLNAKAESHKITLFTTQKNSAFDDDSIKYEHLSKLHLHFPSMDKEFDSKIEGKMPFVSMYKEKYGIVPNKYTVRGFDITYDILMRLGSADDIYHAASYNGTTEYVENKFRYTQDVLGGYFNNAAYLIKFDDDLKLTIVK